MYKNTPKVVHGGGRYPQPDAVVHKIENDFIKNSSGILGVGNMSITQAFPARPAHGTLGDPVVLWANFFEVKPGPKLAYYRYSVTITATGNAPQPSKTKIQRICDLLIQDQEDLRGVYTDFRSNLYSLKKLASIPRDITIPYRAQGEDDAPANPATYRISIQDTGTVVVSQYEEYLKSSATNKPPFPQRDEALQTLNIVLGHHPQMRLDIATIGQNKHYPIQPSVFTNLRGGLHALRGINKSVRPATGRLLLNVNVSHTVCHAPILLSALIDETGLLRDTTRLAKRIRLMRVQRVHLPDRVNKAGKRIPSVAVVLDVARTTDGRGESNPPQVEYDGAGPKRVKFYLMAPQNPPASKGLSAKSPVKGGGSGSGQYVSVWDYFSKHYPRIKMKEGYPVVNVGDKKRPIYLPVEACQVLAGQPVISKLDPNQTREMIQFACRKPYENAGSIVAVGGEVLGFKPPTNAALGKNELTINPDLITVHGRVLVPPQIKYQGTKSLNPSKGSWNMSEGIKFSKPANLVNVAYLVVGSPEKKAEVGQDIVQSVVRFQKALRGLGLVGLKDIYRINPIDPPYIDNGRLEQCLSFISRSNVQVLLVILPYNDPTIYGQIKSVADRTVGLHTVCVVRQKFVSEKGQDQYFANVALKFNLKAGGSNHLLDPTKLGIIKDGQTMVVGIDVTHPSPQSQGNAPSVAGIVASIDKTLAQWPSTTSVQRGRTEMVADLQQMFKSRLQLWQKHNKVLPANILVYRDGVSEGQYQTVLDEELPCLRAACTSLYPAKGAAPAISLIIVGKRHHVRFYPTDATKCDDKSNCRNGTVVDRGVTEVRAWEFYLQAHACLQGTARSAHYYVLLDEIFTRRAKLTKSNAANALEELTHNLCHLFGRATKAVSVCPPAYYADLVCERSRHYLANYFDPTTAGGSSSSSTPPSESGSLATGGGGGGGKAKGPGGNDDDDGRPEPDAVMRKQIVVHEKLKDSMYYI